MGIINRAIEKNNRTLTGGGKNNFHFERDFHSEIYINSYHDLIKNFLSDYYLKLKLKSNSQSKKFNNSQERHDEKNSLNFIVILSMHLLFFLYSFGAVFAKLASRELFMSPKFIFFYFGVLINLFIYAIFWQQVIKKISLTVAYANRAICVLWGILWGFLFFHEQIKMQTLVGAFIVILGIIMVAMNE